MKASEDVGHLLTESIEKLESLPRQEKQVMGLLKVRSPLTRG